MGRRNLRSNMVSRALEASGWSRDPWDAGIIPEWSLRFPHLPLVADGRKETGFTRRGRGTTAFDLFRKVENRCDFLSIKTEAIEGGTKFPSKISLSTGKMETVNALLSGIRDGASLPTLIWASVSEDGEPSEDGWAIMIDLAPHLRDTIPQAPEGGWGRGNAPVAYWKWSAGRNSGGKRATGRENLEYPRIDERGRKWTSPTRVHYPELVVSLAALGIHRGSWQLCPLSEVSGMVEENLT